MSSLFYANPCKLDVDLLVGQVAWSNVDPIAAVSASTVEDDRDTNNQVLFINNEVPYAASFLSSMPCRTKAFCLFYKSL